VYGSVAGAVVLFQVADTGRGMTPEQLAKLFGPSSRFTGGSIATRGSAVPAGDLYHKRLSNVPGGDYIDRRAWQGLRFTLSIPGRARPF
jgi:hypothetical protein